MMKRTLSLIPSLLLIVACLWGQSVIPKIDTDAICRHIEELASDSYLGRKSGTAGETKTLAYLEAQFRRMGLQPGNAGSFLQKIPLAYYSSTAPASIRFQTEDGTEELQRGKDYYLSSTVTRPEIDVQSDGIVFAGFGIHAPEIGWDDYADVDVRGKIVMVLADTPDLYSRDTSLWKGDPAANLYGKTFYKKKEAAARGAAGLFIIFREQGPGHFSWDMLESVYAQPSLKIREAAGAPQLQVSGYLRREAAARLLRAAGLSATDYQERALRPSFQAETLALPTRFILTNSWTDLNTHNVAALLPGTERADEVIIYTAHWDHVGTGPAIAGDSIRNGAVDNASGTAALLEIARAYKRLPEPPQRSILFLATGAEEMGLLGALWYAAHPIFPLGKTVAALNMDAHFPYGKTTHVLGVVYGRSELDTYLEAAARQQGRTIIPNTEGNIAQDIFFRSDHYPFAEAGIPSEFAVGSGGPMEIDSTVWHQKMAIYAGKYHQPSDEYEADFDCSGIAQDAELIFRVGYELSRNDHFPRWKADQPFQRFRQEALENAAPEPADMSLNMLLDKHAEAMGGTKEWKRLKSWVITQKRKNGTVIATAKKPDMFRLDFHLDGRHRVKSYDGKQGWITNDGAYEAMRPGEAIEMAEEPDFYGELIFARERGLPMEMMESEQLNGHWCYRLKLIKSDTDEQWYWLNADTYLIEQTAEYSEDPAHDGIFYKTVFGDYRSVDGLMFPTRESLIANDDLAREWTLEKIEVNKKIPSNLFRYREKQK
jgi:hypothetical protein